jgi:dynein heavy chain
MLDGEFKKHEQWDYAKKMMADVGGFMTKIETFDARVMSDQLVGALATLTESEGFNEADMKIKSGAAANLCAFVVNMYKFNRIYAKVEPLMTRIEEARATEAAAMALKDAALAKVAALQANLDALQAALEANAKKVAAESIAKST